MCENICCLESSRWRRPLRGEKEINTILLRRLSRRSVIVLSQVSFERTYLLVVPPPANGRFVRVRIFSALRNLSAFSRTIRALSSY